MVNRIYPPIRGPTGRLLYDLARHLADEGYDVTVLSADRQDKQDARSEDLTGVKIIRARGLKNPRKFLANLYLCVSLFVSLLSVKRPDILITMTDPPFFHIFAGIYIKLRGIKHIHWCQDMYPDIMPALSYNLPQFLLSFLQKRADQALSSCAYIVAISKCMRRKLAEKELHKHQLKVIENWYDEALFEQKEAEQLDLPEKFRVMFAGNLGRAHPMVTILSAAKLLNEKDRDIEFVFMGSGRGYERMAQERARMGLDNIRFIPFQPGNKYRKIMESGDVHIISMKDDVLGYLMPSRIYDIFAVKRPCLFIGPKKCEITAILEKYNAGLQIDQGKPEILAQEIRNFRDDGAAWYQYQDGAMQAGQDYVPAASLKKWMKLISTLVK